MQLEFQCQKCEESFSMDVSDIQSDPVVRCPGCGTRAPDEQVEAVVSGLEELFAALAPLRRKFTASVEVNSEDMPPPYDEAPAVSRKAALLDEEDSEDEEGDEDREEGGAELGQDRRRNRILRGRGLRPTLRASACARPRSSA